MTKQGAIELSLNMLVVVIISLVILTGGIIFLYKLIAGAEDIKADLDSRTQAELERLLVEQGKQVALPFRQATIERGESHVFGLGLLNIGEPREFRLHVQLSSAKDRQNADLGLTAEQVQDWLLYNAEPFTLAENEHRNEGLLVKIPKTAAAGQYLFSVEVLTEENKRYGNSQLLVVEVR